MSTFARVLYQNLIKTQTALLTPSTEDAEYPATNLYNDNYSEVWRTTTSASQQTLVINMNAAVSVSAIALGNINFSSSATVKIQWNTSDSWGAPAGEETLNVSGLDGKRRCLYHELSATQTYQYWRLVITDTTLTEDFLELGELSLGIPVELFDNFDISNTKQLVRNNTELRTEYNQAYVYTRDYGFIFDLTWTNAYETTRDQLLALELAQDGSGTPFFFVFDPTVPAEAYYVRFNGPFNVSKIGFDRYNLACQFVEEFPGLTIPR